ncbi:GntR family transcriptional regulator [Sinorhizobium glycinis]|uniref:GntR family transcriptional regulator n=1 Tax=Sinorhizobium glycinis TaxID=1472378 RepID=UPI0009EE1F36|nr:GntR family transcriptional regulator [Sinorhizobium glycinis]
MKPGSKDQKIEGVRGADESPAGAEARADAAYRFLRNAILTNEIPVGFQATEVEIAARLGMSRTPVHEAMARLQEEGFVQILPRRGILVKGLSPADLLEIYDILIGLEGAAAERLALEGGDAISEVVQELENLTERMELALDAGDMDAWADADEAFHDALVARCGNGRIRRLAGTVSGQSHRARRLTLNMRPPPAQSVIEHRQIIHAIEAADPIAAGSAARAHRRRARDQLVPILRRLNFSSL